MSAQPTFFDAHQDGELARISGAIAGAILGFCRRRLASGESEFHAAELREAVRYVSTAPGSADRILRALRQAHQLDYVIVNRRQSLYRVVRVAS